MKPLSYTQTRYLSAVRENPGLSRSELAKLLYPDQNEFYSLKRVVSIHKRLEVRGLVELGEIREGGRFGVSGVYLVGQERPEKRGYFGVHGWVKT